MALLLAGSIGAYVVYVSAYDMTITVHRYDTKGAKSALIRTPGDHRYLVNGGSNGEIVRHITEELPFYSRRIDGVFVLQPDGKHATGLVDVLGRYDVGRIYLPAFATTTDGIFEEFMKVAKQKKVSIQRLKEGDEVELDVGVKVEVLFPADQAKFAYTKASPPALVMKLVSGDKEETFTDKLSKKIEKYMDRL